MPTDEGHASAGTKRILIVEDDSALGHALELKLQHEGFVTVQAGNGTEGVRFVTEESFDLILLDLIMPEMDGFAVLEELRKREVATPVITMSNLNQEEDVERVKTLGAREHLVKVHTPVKEIIERIKAAL